MAKIIRRAYTAAEKAAYVAEFERLYRAGGRTYASIGQQLGVAESNYFAWVAQGIKAPAPAAKPASAGKPRIVYTPDERERLVAEVERRVAAGEAVRVACRAAGIGEKSYRAWRAARRAAAPLPMREVAVTALVPAPAAAPEPAVTLVAPGGYRVEGLDIENAARLLRALAC